MQQPKTVKPPTVQRATQPVQTSSVQPLAVKRATPTPPPTTPPIRNAGIQRRPAYPRAFTPALVMDLQGAIGNQAVQRIMQQHAVPSPDVAHPPTPTSQPKLKVGAVGDTFEQEADQVARQVVQKKGMIQRVGKNRSGDLQGISHASSPAIQRKFNIESSILGSVSLKATANKAKGDESTLSLLKKAIDLYHEKYTYATLDNQLELLKWIYLHAGDWSEKHTTQKKQGTGLHDTVARVREAAEKEINAVKTEMQNEPETQQAYLNKVDGGNFKYLSSEGQKLSQDMKLWSQGQESPRAAINQEKYANRAEPYAQVTQKHGLTKAEATAIGIYTASDYRTINPGWSEDAGWMKSALPRVNFANNETRGTVKVNQVTDQQVEEATQEGQEHGKIALSGLKKLPDWTGTVYRGEGLTQAQFNAKYKNKSGIFPAFMSTGQKIDAANSFLMDVNGDEKVLTRLTITVIKGKNVADISDAPHEKEIVLLPGSKYKVKKIKQTPPNAQGISKHHDVMDVELIQTA